MNAAATLDLQTREASKKLFELEAIRGVASLIVVFHHFTLAFAPGFREGLRGTPGAFIVNGEGAVTLFFVLSGFVLTRRYFLACGGDVAGAALKRLPRLMVPAAFSTLLGYLVLTWGSAWYVQAATISHSDWLISFGAAGQSKSFAPSLPDAFIKSVTVFLWPLQFQYNSNLWTMLPEFIGSVFCFAYVAIAVRTKKPIVGVILLIVLALTWRRLPWLAPFILGVALAEYLPSKPTEISLRAGVLAMIAGVSLWCSDHYSLRNVGAVLIIGSVLICPRLAESLSGKVGRWFGHISFPLYLVHTLVICSLSSFAFVLSKSIALTALVTLVASIVLAQPFVWLEAWWVPLLSRWVKRRRQVKTAKASIQTT